MNEKDNRKPRQPTPPPLSEYQAPEQDLDNMSTLPANSPWLAPLKHIREETEAVYANNATQHPDPAPNPVGRKPISDASLKSRRPDRKGFVLKRLIIGLIVCAILLIGAAVGVFVAVLGKSWKEPEAATVVIPVAPIALSAPSAPSTETIQKQRQAYQAEKVKTLHILSFIAGKPAESIAQETSFQNIEQLLKKTALKQTALAEDLGLSLDEALLKSAKEKIISYDVLHRFGLAAFDAATKQVDIMIAAGESIPDLKASEEGAKLKAWLVEWMMGKRGLFCQLRDRFLEQVKTEIPPIGHNKKEKLAAIRKEREKFIAAFQLEDTPFYEYCDKDLLLPSQVGQTGDTR